MRKASFEDSIVYGNFTDDEKALIKNYGECEKTRNFLLFYCLNCNKFTCTSCYLQDHKNHEIIQNNTESCRELKKILETQLKRANAERCDTLNSMMQILQTNLGNLRVYGDSVGILVKNKEKLSEIIEKISSIHCNRIKEWVFTNEKMIKSVLDMLEERRQGQLRSYNNYIENYSNNHELNIRIQNFLCQKYIERAEKGVSNDKKMQIEEIPSQIAEFKNMYKALIEKIAFSLAEGYFEMLNYIGVVVSSTEYNEIAETVTDAIGKSIEKQHKSSNNQPYSFPHRRISNIPLNFSAIKENTEDEVLESSLQNEDMVNSAELTSLQQASKKNKAAKSIIGEIENLSEKKNK